MSSQRSEFKEFIPEPFKIKEPTEKLNFRLVANVESDALYFTGDADPNKIALNNFVSSSLPEKVDFETFAKLFRLSQLAIDFYSKEENQHDSDILE